MRTHKATKGTKESLNQEEISIESSNPKEAVKASHQESEDGNRGSAH